MAQGTLGRKSAHFSLGFFSFLRGGGTGASAPVAAASLSFFTTFLTSFFFGGSAGVFAAAAATDDSIRAAMVSLGFTPICAKDTAPTGGVGTSVCCTVRPLLKGAEAVAGGEAGDATGVSSLAMMAVASDAASSTSLSGVGNASAVAGGARLSLPTGLRPSATKHTALILSFCYARRLVLRSHYRASSVRAWNKVEGNEAVHGYRNGAGDS